MVLETSAAVTGTGSYDILLGTDAVTAVSLVNGPVSVTVYGDGYFVDNTYNDQITTALFDVGDVATGEKLFLVFKRVSASSWFGVDNVVINKTLASGRLEYSYGMSVQPSTQDHDGTGGNDIHPLEEMPVNGGGFGVQTNRVGKHMYRTDFNGSIWRSQFFSSRDYTIDFRVNITTNSIEGNQATFALAARRSGSGLTDNLELKVKRTGFYTSGIGFGEDNTGWHTYRVACSESGFQVWRDGLPINGTLKALGSTTKDDTLLGDYDDVNLGGEYYIDYYRLDSTGAYAPPAPVEAGTKMQWGLDYTSGLVADQNGGIVEDDSANDNDGQKYYNNPAYSAEMPSAGLLRDCTGVGSFNLATTGHTSIKTINRNIITIEEMVAAGGVTMEVWAKQTAAASTLVTGARGRGMIMTMQDAFTIASLYGKYKIVVNSFDNDGPELAITETEKIDAGWIHFAAIVKDFAVTGSAETNYTGTVELWVNGELQDSTAIDYASTLDLTRSTAVGAALKSGADDFRWDGYIYEPRVTLGVLDAKEFTIVKTFGTVILIQ